MEICRFAAVAGAILTADKICREYKHKQKPRQICPPRLLFMLMLKRKDGISLGKADVCGMAKKKLVRPLLSIGIIFKNEIRCLERCLASLAPLREKVPCELIMADTGSDDGSREVAARYADVLFDFPWMNDFAAARNAVLEKAIGKWYLSIDADEWLDKDVSELAGFFYTSYAESAEICSLTVRNYYLSDSDSEYADIQGLRLVRRMPWTRFEGSIHERLELPEGRGWHITVLSKTVLHHDGYVCMNEGRGEDKVERNLTLLRNELEKKPKDLTLLLQYIESGKSAPDYQDMLEKAVRLVKQKNRQWNYEGPVIFRHAVMDAYNHNLSKLDERIACSREWFPDSFFTRIDVEYLAFGDSWQKSDYVECIVRGERYLQAIEDYRGNRGERVTLMSSALMFSSVHDEQQVRVYMSQALAEEGEHLKALKVLEGIGGQLTDQTHVGHLRFALSRIQSEGGCDTSPVVRQVFESCNSDKTSTSRAGSSPGVVTDSGSEQESMGEKSRGEQFWNAFERESIQMFTKKYREKERESEKYCRPAYTLFLPLADACDLGRAAALLETKDLGEIERLTSKIKDWARFPADVLFHALTCGLGFPVEDLSLNSEKMDKMVETLIAGHDNMELAKLAKGVLQGNQSGISRKYQQIVWGQRFAFAILNAFDWKGDGDGLAVVRYFARAEKEFLETVYSVEAMKEENFMLLQSEHRFGRRCADAFETLDAGDFTGYVKKLRQALGDSPETRYVAEYLLNHTPQLQEVQRRRRENASPELLALARQVKAVLENYAPDDPAVAALKESGAYQKVAWLMEED